MGRFIKRYRGISKFIGWLGLFVFLVLVGSGLWYSTLLAPDLVPVGIHYEGSEDNFTQVLTVKNEGVDVKLPVSARVDIYTSATGGAFICGDAWTVSLNRRVVIAGGSLLTAERTWPGGWKLSGARKCGGVWKVVVDDNLKVKESDESNNTRFLPNQ